MDGTGLLALAGKGYDPEQYQWEKIIGKRRPTGALKLKRLNGRHRTIIALHLRGMSGRDIAEIMGLSEVNISLILNDPISREFINAHFNGVEGEVRALLADAIDVIRDALTNGSTSMKMKAAEKIFKMSGMMDSAKDNKEDETAEDVVAKVLGIMENQSSAINSLVQDRRISNIIDVNPEKEPSVKLIESEDS